MVAEQNSSSTKYIMCSEKIFWTYASVIRVGEHKHTLEVQAQTIHIMSGSLPIGH